MKIEKSIFRKSKIDFSKIRKSENFKIFKNQNFRKFQIFKKNDFRFFYSNFKNIFLHDETIFFIHFFYCLGLSFRYPKHNSVSDNRTKIGNSYNLQLKIHSEIVEFSRQINQLLSTEKYLKIRWLNLLLMQ